MRSSSPWRRAWKSTISAVRVSHQSSPEAVSAGEDWWDTRTAEIVDFHARRHGEDDRIEVGFAPHAAYTVPVPVLADVAGEARRLDALFHIHLAETEEEGIRFAAEHGD